MSSILLSNGRLVDPFSLKPEDFDLRVVSHSLSLLNRYTGHTRKPISVAEHSYLLSLAVPVHLARAAILHDVNESLTNDLPRPFKKRLPDFVDLEELVQKRLFQMLDEPWENMNAIREYDLRICADEMIQLMDYDPGYEPLGVVIQSWDATTAALHFYDRALELGVPCLVS